VIHNISLPPGVFGTGLVHDLFLNQLDVSRDPWLEQLAGLRVSAHFLIEREGQITQFVLAYNGLGTLVCPRLRADWLATTFHWH